MKHTKILLIIIICLLSLNVLAQENSINNTWKIKLGFGLHKAYNPNCKPISYQLELDYGVLDYFEIGLYGGFALVKSYPVDPIRNVIVYGTNLNFHIIPLIFPNKKMPIDVYFSGKVGGDYFKDNELEYNLDNKGYKKFFTIDNIGNTFEYGMGIGMSFYVFPQVGVFGEFNMGKFFSNEHKNLRAGLVFKW